ncbi:MAG TPA: bifunctional hydroxymethylpyrimidine kinase/phosphomethylpyrimidine kinase [Candidatus Hydrogenedentes bacterium]|nr:bifunctional hydroxymethylpyrimidine kinase/phosphomethylpyrimidine kinase [Candidatus Hydrogenedentota bacterium]HRK34072.1 bifunctional hydroxymethylpyrimidine kinase/phosphomethylpyrimidine kinase [Candidatus Hydrogenedentota bacterium]
MIPRALTIAGSDSGGGAGIQADLKTFAALKVYGMSAITSVTAQNTVGVAGVHDVPAAFVARQIEMVVEDIGVDAAKTGMLSNAEIVLAVADAVKRLGIGNLVVDPVMVAKSGDALLQTEAQHALKSALLPLAHVVTPNLPEAEALTGEKIADMEGMKAAAVALYAMGPRHVVIKGGHLAGAEAIDLLYDGVAFQTFSASRIDTKNTHGTGCTFSAAIAALLAKGHSVVASVEGAKAYLTKAIRHALPLGKGHGPLMHHWMADDATRDIE